MIARRPYHFTEALHLISEAQRTKSTVNIKAWKIDGNINYYEGWYVISNYWIGGYLKLRNPVNNEIRRVPEIYIFEINGHKIYL